jgi:hypothetical protein
MNRECPHHHELIEHLHGMQMTNEPPQVNECIINLSREKSVVVVGKVTFARHCKTLGSCQAVIVLRHDVPEGNWI